MISDYAGIRNTEYSLGVDFDVTRNMGPGLCSLTNSNSQCGGGVGVWVGVGWRSQSIAQREYVDADGSGGSHF